MTLNSSKKPRQKTCGNQACGSKFIPQRMGQKVCSPACALATKDVHAERARKAIQQRERQAHKAAKEKIMSRADWLKKAQAAFNAYIRERDRGQPCISCGTTADVQYCAGHYRTVGACRELRFEPLNVHLQCNKNCNLEKSGNIVGYRPRLLAKIGEDALAWLEGPHEPKKYTIDELKSIRSEYSAKARELKKRHDL